MTPITPPPTVYLDLELRSLIENMLRTTGRETIADAVAALPEGAICAPHDLPSFLRGHARTLDRHGFPGTSLSLEAMADRVEKARNEQGRRRRFALGAAFALGMAFALALLLITRGLS